MTKRTRSRPPANTPRNPGNARSRDSKSNKATSKGYKPTAAESAALDRVLAKSGATARIKVSAGGLVVPDHPSLPIGYALLMESVGTADVNFLTAILSQIANAVSKGQTVDESALNFALSVVQDIKPKDHIEAMLAVQMAGIHLATMTMTRRLVHVETLPQQDSAERALNKLARTFTTQVEALKRYRTGGQQRMTVEHVTVNQGGQAIVGNVNANAPNTRSQGDSEKTLALSDQSGTAMEMEHVPAKAKARVRRKN